MLTQGRIPSLDGFRTISIVLVMIAHLTFSSSIPDWMQTILKNFSLGDLGVRIFFVISGLVITYLLLKERSKTGHIDLKAFYIRRALRIFPAFYFYLFVIILLNYFLDLGISPLMFLSAGIYLMDFAPWGESWLVSHTWSLAVEEQFYLLWPVVFLRIRRMKKILIWVCAIALGSVMRVFHYKYPAVAQYFLSPFLMQADFLFSGCYMAFYLYNNLEAVESFVRKVPSAFIYLLIPVLLVFSKLEFHPVYDIIFVPLAGAVINFCICTLLLYFIIRKDSIGYKFLNLSMMI
ncbi:MAG: acyltransferase family protein, partial [Cytophagaceae bacterium]